MVEASRLKASQVLWPVSDTFHLATGQFSSSKCIPYSSSPALPPHSFSVTSSNPPLFHLLACGCRPCLLTPTPHLLHTRDLCLPRTILLPISLHTASHPLPFQVISVPNPFSSSPGPGSLLFPYILPGSTPSCFDSQVALPSPD